MPDENEQPKELEVPLEWYVPDSIVSQYATNMVVQHFEHEFVVSFFDAKPPLIVGVPSKEVLDSLKSIRATCVARIVIAAARMPGFVNALQTSLENALSKKETQELGKE